MIKIQTCIHHQHMRAAAVLQVCVAKVTGIWKGQPSDIFYKQGSAIIEAQSKMEKPWSLQKWRGGMGGSGEGQQLCGTLSQHHLDDTARDSWALMNPKGPHSKSKALSLPYRC